MYSFVARQPIIDGKLAVIGFELLYRDGVTNAFPNVDSNKATKELLVEQCLVLQGKVFSGKKAFINFDQQSLVEGVPIDFPNDMFVIEILETCSPTDALFSAIKQLDDLGFTIALDDFVMADEWERFLPMIDIIKFDMKETSLPVVLMYMKQTEAYDLKYLAEKVETFKEFEHFKELGFEYFQGFFFSRPEMIKNRRLSSSTQANLNLCKAVSELEIDYAQVEKIIATDTSLSFKLLRFVNACSSITTPIHSFKQALAYLGEQRLRKFVSYVAILGMANNKTNELFVISLKRAKFLEEVLSEMGRQDIKGDGYLCGLLSLIDAVLDMDAHLIINPLNIELEIKEAILSRTGLLGNLLNFIEAFEQSDWQGTEKWASILELSDDTLVRCERDAAYWVSEIGMPE